MMGGRGEQNKSDTVQVLIFERRLRKILTCSQDVAD